jgi:hypothetical protein
MREDAIPDASGNGRDDHAKEILQNTPSRYAFWPLRHMPCITSAQVLHLVGSVRI